MGPYRLHVLHPPSSRVVGLPPSKFMTINHHMDHAVPTLLAFMDKNHARQFRSMYKDMCGDEDEDEIVLRELDVKSAYAHCAQYGIDMVVFTPRYKAIHVCPVKKK